MALKITPADSAFSKCIRERASWCCEVCGTGYTPSDKGLQCSHYFGRGNWSVRFDPENAEAACTACHFEMETNPHAFSERWREKLGPVRYEALLERKNDLNRGREYRRTKGKGDVAKHYRDELKRMQDSGDKDFCGWI